MSRKKTQTEIQYYDIINKRTKDTVYLVKLWHTKGDTPEYIARVYNAKVEAINRILSGEFDSDLTKEQKGILRKAKGYKKYTQRELSAWERMTMTIRKPRTVMRIDWDGESGDTQTKEPVTQEKPANKNHLKGSRRLTDNNVRWIRKNHIPGDKVFGCRAMGERFGVSGDCIWCIIKGKTYKHLL